MGKTSPVVPATNFWNWVRGWDGRGPWLRLPAYWFDWRLGLFMSVQVCGRDMVGWGIGEGAVVRGGALWYCGAEPDPETSWHSEELANNGSEQSTEGLDWLVEGKVEFCAIATGVSAARKMPRERTSC